MYNIRETILEERPIITKTELDKLILDAINNKGIVEGPVKRDLLKLLTDTDEKIEDSRDKFIEELSDVTSSSSELNIKSKTTKKVLKKATKTSKETKQKS